MPNCDYYAAGTDHRTVLDFILTRGECDIYEMVSRPQQSIRRFHTLRDFEEHFNITDWATGPAETLYLQLHPHGSRGIVDIRRRECRRSGYDHDVRGWGLVQLHLEQPEKGRLRDSHTNHNSEKRARTFAPHYPDLGSPSAWIWPVISTFSRLLNRYIRSLAVARTGSRVILPAAALIREAGMSFL